MSRYKVGQIWEAIAGTRGAYRTRRRTIRAIDDKGLSVEENGKVVTTTLISFRAWVSNYGAEMVDA